jgi:F-type H+-transporting ATPase subunit gamma
LFCSLFVKMASLLSPFRFSSKAVHAPQFVRHGSNLKEIKGRMGTVKNIQKITKTMKLVASARLKSAQANMENSRPFSETATQVVNDFPKFEESLTNNHLCITISTDRGLCGAINTFSVKTTRALAEEAKKSKETLRVASLGEKGTAQLNRFLPQNLLVSCHETSKFPINFYSIGLILDEILEAEKWDKVSVIFNKFISVMTSETQTKTFSSYHVLQDQLEKGFQNLDAYEFEEEPISLHLRDMMEFHLASTIYNAYLENQTSELGARMNSMDNASNNASDMLKNLTIAYNRGRQAAITTELIEIISGAEAL